MKCAVLFLIKIVKTNTIKTVCNTHKIYHINYLSIDVEGGERDIIESIDFDLYKIKVLSIENNNPSEVNYEEYLSKKGFCYIPLLETEIIL